MKKSDKFILKEVAGSYVLVTFGEKELTFNGIITLNDTAKYLWENIDGEFDSDSLTEMLCKAYEVDEPTARKSADKFIDILKEVGAVE